MPSLRELDLSKVGFLEVLPSCPQLSVLSLKSMPATALGILESCPELEQLQLFQISGLAMIPDKVGNCQRLQKIEIKHCSDLERVGEGIS